MRPIRNDAAADPSTAFPARRSIRSFVLRQGRFSPAQQRAYELLLPRYGVPFSPVAIDLVELFGRVGPKILEIGFGMGETTAAIAKARPADDFVAIEVHSPGVGALLRLIDDERLANVRIIQHDAVEVVECMLARDSLDGIHVFFPDPWPKKKHHKRRLLQSAFVRALAERLRPRGYLHVATDWEEYAQEMLQTLRTEPLLANAHAQFAPRPAYRPLTKFERRGMKLGHGVWDLVFERR